jgi:hypothetical protein
MQKEKEGQWLLTMLRQGTLSDKITALSMIVQQNPDSSLSYLNQLLTLAKKKNRK